jgi:hypothetical protein
LALACAAASLAPFGGCAGGTSTEAGNPGVTFEFFESSKPSPGQADFTRSPFTGFIQIVATDSNPAFFRPPPDDGNNSPRVIIGGTPGISLLAVTDVMAISLSQDELARSLYAHAELPLLKRSAAARRPLPDFNVILIGKDPAGNPLAGWVRGVHPDADGKTFSFADGRPSAGQAFAARLTPEHRCFGKVDTATTAGKPLALFVPGTPYYSQVHAGTFRFEGVPAGRLPLRWISADGWVYAMQDSLGAPDGKDTVDYEMPGFLQPGARLDSLSLPPEIPTLAPPAASPSGQYAFTDSVAITLSAGAGAAIYYSLDGSLPDLGSKRYDKPILLRSSATLKAVAYLKGYNHSPISVNNYVLVPAAPVAKPAGTAFRDSLRVGLTAPTAGATIRYTLDGSLPTAASPAYKDSLLITATTTLKAAAEVAGLGLSQAIEEKYILVPDSSASP